MVVFPNAKINLGLNVVRRGEDGFHDIETVFYPINLKEALEVLPIESGENKFSSTGIDIPESKKGNLVLQAYDSLAKDFDLPHFDFRLHKLIPIGAGLGGGSADASFAIKAIDQLCDLNLSSDQMEAYAAKLGSDCPFFIANRATYATGRGDVFHEIQCSLSNKYLLLINPAIHVSTALAYSGVTPKISEIKIPDILSRNPKEWKDLLKNDFEVSVFKAHPILSKIKEKLYAQGAVYASMSGSGSTMFGVFDEKPDDSEFHQYFNWVLPL